MRLLQVSTSRQPQKWLHVTLECPCKVTSFPRNRASWLCLLARSASCLVLCNYCRWFQEGLEFQETHGSVSSDIEKNSATMFQIRAETHASLHLITCSHVYRKATFTKDVLVLFHCNAHIFVIAHKKSNALLTIFFYFTTRDLSLCSLRIIF